MPQQEIELIDYMRVLFRQKWVILATLIVALGTAWLLSEVTDPTYRASASLLLMPSLASELDSSSTGSLLPDAAYTELGSSTTVLRMILDEIDSTSKLTLPELMRDVSFSSRTYPSEDEQSRARPVLLGIDVRGPDPEEVAAIASAWIQAFTETYGSLFEDRTARSYNYVLASYQLTEAELAQAIDERLNLLREQSLEVLWVERNVLKERLGASKGALDLANLELETTRALHASHTRLSLNHEPSTVLSDQVDPFTLAGALLLGLSSEQFEQLLSSRIQVLQSNVITLREELQAKQWVVDAAQIALEDFDRRIALLAESVAFLSARLQAAKLALAETPDPIIVIDEPLVAKIPISPRIEVNLGIAGVLGVLLGTLLAFVIDYLQRVREREQAARRANSRGADREENPHSEDGNCDQDEM